MTRLPFIGSLISACLGLAFTAQASTGQINSFSASATSVTAGTLVDFTVDFGLSTDGSIYGGSDLNEPAPIEGNQFWALNWHTAYSETVSSVWLSAYGESFTDYPSVPSNSSHNGTWQFSILFQNEGTYDITLDGGWMIDAETYHSNENASRDCYNEDPGGSNLLICSSWNYSYDDGTDHNSITSAFAPQTITIQVAAVPEPQSLALLLAGVAVLGMVRRRRAG